MSEIFEGTITIPGTDVKLPKWAPLAAGAGIIAALILAPKGARQDQGDFDEEGYYEDEGEGGILGLMEMFAEWMAGFETPGLLLEPLPGSPVPRSPYIGGLGDDYGESYGTNLPPILKYFSISSKLGSSGPGFGAPKSGDPTPAPQHSGMTQTRKQKQVQTARGTTPTGPTPTQTKGASTYIPRTPVPTKQPAVQTTPGGYQTP